MVWYISRARQEGVVSVSFRKKVVEQNFKQSGKGLDTTGSLVKAKNWKRIENFSSFPVFLPMFNTTAKPNLKQIGNKMD